MSSAVVRSVASSCASAASSASSTAAVRRPLLVASYPATAATSSRVVCRTYVSRAHPRPVPTYPIADAVRTLLEGVEERKVRREERWERNKEKIAARKGIEIDGPYRNQDETIEIAINLNLDPRKPGQALRGSLSLPHGSGKDQRVVVFTTDEAKAKEALEAGAVMAGGTDLIENIQSGAVPVSSFDRAVATPDVMSMLSPVARLLGPRGLMPNAKVGTIQPPDKLVEAVHEQRAGQVQYRTDKAGIVHAGVAKGSFGPDKILDNVREFMNGLQDVKPESFGKSKKKGGPGKGKTASTKNAKYFLKAHVTASQGQGIEVDLRTLDPTSAFFMSTVKD